MASSVNSKTPCSICAKPISILTCRGCQKDFCMRHTLQHRQELSRQFDELLFNHNQCRQDLIEQMGEKLNHHPLIKQIDQWEQQSIDKIHQTANEIRQQLKITISKYTKNLSIILTDLTQELNQAHKNYAYLETDLNEWISKLDKLKENLLKPEIIKIEQEENIISLIKKPFITIYSTEIIEQITKYFRIENNGQVIIHSHHVHGHAAARGTGEYLTGKYHFRFQIQSFHENKWLFIGIISKNKILREDLFNTPSCYGWASPNQVYIDGKNHIGYKGYKADIENNDIMETIIDCDRRKIYLINERTYYIKWELNIDLNKCPFPWQLHFNLHYANDRICILSN